MRTILTMIVGADTENMKRALASALPYVDGVCVQFNGPSSHVSELAEATRDQVRGTAGGGPRVDVYFTSWVSFGANRTAVVEDARALCTFWQWDPADTYALVLDSDCELRGMPPSGVAPGAPGYYLEHRHGDGGSYRKLDMLRLDLPWKFDRYPTHEVVECAGVNTLALPNAHGFHTFEHDDSADRGDKYARDERLIRAYLAEHPDDHRMRFYLAQTLWCVWKADRSEARRAAAFVANCNAAASDPWDQQRYIALLRAAECAPTVDDMSTLLNQATRTDPRRAEAWIMAGHMAHGIRAWWLMASHGLKASNSYIEPDMLFVDRASYTWKALDMMALGLFRQGQVSDARQAWVRALTCADPEPTGAARRAIIRGLEECSKAEAAAGRQCVSVIR